MTRTLTPALNRVNQLGRVPGVFHEPEADVDALRLVSDVVDENGAAVFVRGIAEAIERACRRGGYSESGNQNSDHQSDTTCQVHHKNCGRTGLPGVGCSAYCEPGAMAQCGLRFRLCAESAHFSCRCACGPVSER